MPRKMEGPVSVGPLTPEEKARLKELAAKMMPGLAVLRRVLGDTTPVTLPSTWVESNDPAILKAGLFLTRYRLH